MIGDLIKEAVESIAGTVYIRATDYDANTAIHNIDLKDKILCIYNNLPVVSHSFGVNILRNWPVEIKVLQLADVDDNTSDGDIIRAECFPVCDKIFDYIINDPRTNQAEPPDDYTINPQEKVLIFDSTMTGLQLEFTIKVDRKACYITPEP